MAKEYFVEIGTRKRPVRYTRAERIEIEKRFDVDLRDFIYKLCFPQEAGPDGKLKPTGGGRLEAQEALVYYGVRHIGGKITEDSIAAELQEHVKSGASIYGPVLQAVAGLLTSGLLGWTPKLEEEDEPGKDAAGEKPVAITTG